MRGLRLSLIVPVRNDAAGLAQLSKQAAALRCFEQIVVVDDGSDDPLRMPANMGVRLTMLRHETALGPGVARNSGLAAATCDYVMFADADDRLTAELPHLLADLADECATSGPFDFCLFKHADSRVTDSGGWGQPHWDEDLWQQSGQAMGALRPAPPWSLPILAQTANYPWNKICRRDFLRRNGIGCAPTLVHEDVSLHWQCFLAAARVLTSDRVCLWHGVSRGGERLSNLSGSVRLQVFEALTPVAERVALAAPVWQLAFSAFASGLLNWAEGQIAPDLAPELRARAEVWRRTCLPWSGEGPP